MPDALLFDGRNVSEFIKRWDLECDEFGHTENEKWARFFWYCTDEIAPAIKLLPSYLAKDWPGLQKELKSLFARRDIPEFTVTALTKLVDNFGKMHFSVFILQYIAMSKALIKRGSPTSPNCLSCLLSCLPVPLQHKTLPSASSRSGVSTLKRRTKEQLNRTSML